MMKAWETARLPWWNTSVARSFDGANDRLTLGSDASIDEGTIGTSKVVAFWMQRNAEASGMFLVGKDRNTVWSTLVQTASGSYLVTFIHQWSVTSGEWRGSTGIRTGEIRHVVVVYDGSLASNDPAIYVDGVAETVAEITAPTLTFTNDDAVSFLVGETGGGFLDYNGLIQNLTYDNTIWTDAQINLHRWWGRIGGPVLIQHNMFTDKLTNEGTATADITVTAGTTMASLPRVQRPGCAGVW